MKKILVILVITGIFLGFTGISQAKPNNPVIRPVPTTDVKIVKKSPLPPDILASDVRDIKDKSPSPPGKNKNGSSRAATGVLGSTSTGAKYAVVIGICDYPGKQHDLCKSDGDSLRMYKALITVYGYDSGNIYLFKDMGGTYFEENSTDTTDSIPSIIAKKPTRENILGAISAIKATSTSPEDEVVFFFSGHGADGLVDDGDNERRDEGIVVWNNENDTEDNITYIWDGELKTAFTGFATNRIAFVFDTCLAGGMNDLADAGRVISMATRETNVAYVYSSEKVNPGEMEDVDGDNQLDGEGVFTRYFVHKGMLDGSADGYNQLEKTDYNVAVEEAFDYSKENIPKSLQKPVINDNFTNDLLL